MNNINYSIFTQYNVAKINALKVGKKNTKIESKLILKLDLRYCSFQFNSCNLCITNGHVLHNSIMNECKLLLHFNNELSAKDHTQ